MNKEFTEIELIMDRYRKNLDWELIKEYFSLFEMEEKFEELKNKYYGKTN